MAKKSKRLFKVNVYPRNAVRPGSALMELNMIRGAFNRVSGFARLRGLTDERFKRVGRVQFVFPSRRHRWRFVRAVRARMRDVIVRRVLPL